METNNPFESAGIWHKWSGCSDVFKSLADRLQPRRISSHSFLMMLIVSSATFGIALIPSTSSDLLQERFMPGHAQLFKMYDSSYQRLGHKVGLMLLGFTLLTAIVLGNRRQAAHRTPSAAELKFAKRLNQSLGGFLLAGILIRGLGDGISPSSVFYLLASLLMVVACIRFSAYISRKQFSLATLMAAVYLIYWIAPLLFTIQRTPLDACGFLLTGVLITGLGYSISLCTVVSLLASLLIVIAGITLSPHISRRQLLTAASMATIGYLVYLSVPAFLATPHVPETVLGIAQFHYSIVLSWADRLAIDPASFAQRLPHYGLLLPSLLGAYERHFGLLDFGQHIRVVQASQTLFLALSCLALCLWKPNRPLYVLVAIMIFGTFSSTSHIAVFYPNQSGWRFLGFPIWVILLLIFRNTPLKRAAFCLGCGCGALLLANLETGIVMTIGTMVFLVSRAQHVAWRERANHALLFFGGALVAMFTFCALFRAEFDQWPFSLSTLAADTLLHHFCQGYGGRPLVCDLMAAFIFMHCVYLVSSLILRWRDRGISHSAGVKLAVAAAVLTWYAYYMNRPDPWNLWTFLFLYSFLMADFLDRRRLTLLWRRRGMLAFADIRVAALTWLLLPCLLQLNYAHWGQEKAFLAEAARPESAPLSGVNLHRRLVEPLKAKAAYLATMRDKGTTIYLSRDSQLIPLMTGQLNPFDAQDVYLEHFGAPEVERIVHDIRTSNPRYILIDEPFSPLSRTDFAYEYRMPFFDTIVNSLADQYREVGAASDWRILARIQH